MWEKKRLNERLKLLVAQYEQKYSRFNATRDEIVYQARPDLGVDIDDSSIGSLFGDQIYNGTFPWALRVMATGFQGNLVSKSIDWLDYKMPMDRLNGIDPIDKWLQAVKEEMMGAYRRSNYYDVQPQYTLDAMSTASPVMIGDEDRFEDKTIWKPLHYKRCYVIYNRSNRPIGLLVDDPTWTAQDIYREFVNQKQTEDKRKAERQKKLSLKVNKALENGQHDTTFNVIQGIFRADDEIFNADGFDKPFGGQWISVYFEKEHEQAAKQEPLKTDSYYSRPFVVWDYDKKLWEPVSRSPAYLAMYDVYSLQQVQKNQLENIQFQNRKPVIALDTMENRLQLSPEGVMYVTQQEWDRPPKRLEDIGQIEWSEKAIQQLSEAVERHCHLDLFLQFSRLAAIKNQPLTAYQIWQMAGEKTTLLSPAIESHSVYQTDADARMMDIEMRKGRGPFHPLEIANVMDAIVSETGKLAMVKPQPEFVGPLNRAQRSASKLEPINLGLAAGGQLFAMDPDLVNAIRPYDTLDDILTATGFPQKNIRPKDEYEQIKADLQAQRQQAQNMANMIELMKASKTNMQAPIEENSPMAMLGAGNG